MNSSSTWQILKRRPAAVTSNQKSSAHTRSGCSALSRPASTSESPGRRRLRRLGGTRRPSSRHKRWTFLRLTTHPRRNSTACACRYPHRGWFLAKSRSSARKSRSRVCHPLRPITLPKAMLAHDLTSPPLRHSQPPLEHLNSSAPLRRAHHFVRLISRKASISSSLSATIRFNRAFSTSKDFNRFTSSALKPPY